MRSPGAAFDLRAALTQELSAAIEELDMPSPPPAAVHRCRVSLKRARALARVGKPGAPGLSAVFNDSARAVMHVLARMRELTALAGAARSTAKRQKKKDARALLAAAEALEDERAGLPQLDLEKALAGIRDLQALAQVWPEPSARQIRKGAKRVARKARRSYERAHNANTPAARHEWRRREKDRFYAATVLDDAWPGKRQRKLGDKVGDALGKERDARLLIAHIEASPGIATENQKARKQARRILRRRASEMGRRADRLGRELHSADT